MKGCRIYRLTLTTVLALIFSFVPAMAETTKESIVIELRELKLRMEALEEDLERLEALSGEKVAKADMESAEATPSMVSVNAERIDEEKTVLEKVAGRIELSGLIEVEAAYERFDPAEGEKEESSDLYVAEVEFGVDARIHERVRAQLLLYYEEGEDLEVDEAMIHFQALGVFEPDEDIGSPLYASAGRMYLPFGYYESHFITDPITLTLGETRETAVLVGAYGGPFNAAVGVFNSDIDETDGEDHIEDYFAAAAYTLPEEVVPELYLSTGVSYTSNIASGWGLTDYFWEEYGTETLEEYVSGFSAYLTATFMERFSLEVEYVGALDNFEEDEDFEPTAWNFELAFRPIDVITVALRYAISDDAGSFIPETEWGVAAFYDILDNTSLGLEYLYDEFQNGDEVQTVTSQFAVTF